MARDRTVTAAHKSEISRDHGKRQTKNELLLTVKGELRGKICLFRGERPLAYVSIFDKIFSMWVMRT